MKVSTLNVYYENRIVGRIELSELGPSFIYETDWLRTKAAFPISITIPLSSIPVKPNIFIPWAANLLPEGGALRRVGELIQAAPEDVISILKEIGRDTAGALSIDKPGSTDPSQYREVSDRKDLERIINELPRKPFLAGEDGISMSLAGLQSKIGVRLLENGNLAIPINGSPSTHILKPDSRDLVGSVQNEAYCLTLARSCGLNASEVTTGVAGDRKYLLVSRYDRIYAQGLWRRIHQEDFCQALGKPPEAKYERNQTGIRGPTAVDLIAVSQNTMKSTHTLSLLDYIIFNVVVCNTDAHAKNYSIIITTNSPKLAPMYDVVCTQVWDGITENLAQSIADQRRGNHIKRRHWERFAEAAGFNAKSLVNRVRSLMDRVEKQIPAARAIVKKMPAGDHIILNEVQNAILNRIARLRSGLDNNNVQIPVAANLFGTKLDYVEHLRKAKAKAEFSKTVKILERDKNMKAMDIRYIAEEVLNQKYSSKKAALDALAAAKGPEKVLFS